MLSFKKVFLFLFLLVVCCNVVFASDNITDTTSDCSVLASTNNDDGVDVDCLSADTSSSDDDVLGVNYYSISFDDDVYTRSDSAVVKVYATSPVKSEVLSLSLKVYDTNNKLVKSSNERLIANEWNSFTLTGLDNGVYTVYGSILNGEHTTSITLTVNKPYNVKVSAPGVSVTKGASKYFKVTVKNNGVSFKGVKLTVKVYMGKKFKKYTLTTNAKGVVKFNTKGLGLGSHKVVISGGNKYFKINKVSKIKVNKKSNLPHVTVKLYPAWHDPVLKRVKGDVMCGVYETRSGMQLSKGAQVRLMSSPGGSSNGKYIKLVKASFYFKSNNGLKVVNVKASYKSVVKTGLVSGFTPVKAVVFYKKL